jgi:hypothetical protein
MTALDGPMKGYPADFGVIRIGYPRLWACGSAGACRQPSDFAEYRRAFLLGASLKNKIREKRDEGI